MEKCRLWPYYFVTAHNLFRKKPPLYCPGHQVFERTIAQMMVILRVFTALIDRCSLPLLPLVVQLSAKLRIGPDFFILPVVGTLWPGVSQSVRLQVKQFQ